MSELAVPQGPTCSCGSDAAGSRDVESMRRAYEVVLSGLVHRLADLTAQRDRSRRIVEEVANLIGPPLEVGEEVVPREILTEVEALVDDREGLIEAHGELSVEHNALLEQHRLVSEELERHLARARIEPVRPKGHGVSFRDSVGRAVMSWINPVLAEVVVSLQGQDRAIRLDAQRARQLAGILTAFADKGTLVGSLCWESWTNDCTGDVCPHCGYCPGHRREAAEESPDDHALCTCDCGAA